MANDMNRCSKKNATNQVLKALTSENDSRVPMTNHGFPLHWSHEHLCKNASMSWVVMAGPWVTGDGVIFFSEFVDCITQAV
jgi:hypothetical protein